MNPRKLFLIDGLGALLSASMLGIILVRFEDIFGMPAKVLYSLSFIASLFSIYSLACYLRNIKNRRPFLKAIAIANLSYCLLTMGFVTYLYHQLTTLGLLYFVAELIVVIVLSTIELRVASAQMENR